MQHGSQEPVYYFGYSFLKSKTINCDFTFLSQTKTREVQYLDHDHEDFGSSPHAAIMFTGQQSHRCHQFLSVVARNGAHQDCGQKCPDTLPPNRSKHGSCLLDVGGCFKTRSLPVLSFWPFKKPKQQTRSAPQRKFSPN